MGRFFFLAAVGIGIIGHEKKREWKIVINGYNYDMLIIQHEQSAHSAESVQWQITLEHKTTYLFHALAYIWIGKKAICRFSGGSDVKNLPQGPFIGIL